MCVYISWRFELFLSVHPVSGHGSSQIVLKATANGEDRL